MSDSLNVIALISGGKDSFYSILHCQRNGHKIVALANLYPPSQPQASELDHHNAEQSDLNSFMYQTVGHTVIPLYAQALQLPLYRQEILGSAVDNAITYQPSPEALIHDETESLVPLLKRIILAHPQANAISTGAILSTYQRTRIESVALRLGLTPLSYLWQYPHLPPHVPSSLLQDMQSVGLNARIIKVASGGLDESFLWRNVADTRTVHAIERAVNRFGSADDGAVLGEGGEFETLVLDGPDRLFKQKIAVDMTLSPVDESLVVREGGGSAWLRITSAKIESKVTADHRLEYDNVRVPTLFDATFQSAIDTVKLPIDVYEEDAAIEGLSLLHPYQVRSSFRESCWTVVGKDLEHYIPSEGIETEVQNIVDQISAQLEFRELDSRAIVFATIGLKSLEMFGVFNKVISLALSHFKHTQGLEPAFRWYLPGIGTRLTCSQIYGTLFPYPNPPARVTIACGSALAPCHNIILHLKIDTSHQSRKALHVQSRSYWAPANIGPYSQAQQLSSGIYIAGQIPLIPATMTLPEASCDPELSDQQQRQNDFILQSTLAMQHLNRVGAEMNVTSFLGAVAYVPRQSPIGLSVAQRSCINQRLWRNIHSFPSSWFKAASTESNGNTDDEKEEEEERDLWEEKNHAFRTAYTTRQPRTIHKRLPNYDESKFMLNPYLEPPNAPPIFTVMVEALPRESGVEVQAMLGLTSAITVYGIADNTEYTVYTIEVEDEGHRTTYEIWAAPYFKMYGRASWPWSTNGREIMAVWVDTSSNTARLICQDLDIGAAVVPCFHIRDPHNQRIACVVVTSQLRYNKRATRTNHVVT